MSKDKTDLARQDEMYKAIAAWPKGSHYSVEHRIETVTMYAIEGNMHKVARMMGMPYETVRQWRKNAPWWDEFITGFRREKSDELDAMQTNILTKVHEGITDRLDNGDAYVTKDGDIKKKPVSMKDMAVVGGITWEKRQLGRNMPTKIIANTDDKLSMLADSIVKAANPTVIEVTDVVEGKFEKDEEPSEPVKTVDELFDRIEKDEE